MSTISLSKIVIALGKQCAVQITGWPEDADDVQTEEQAIAAIKESIRLGIERNNECNELRAQLRIRS